jgi:uncharacterized protein YndB with AHSA1/START domain
VPGRDALTPELDASILIDAPPARVLDVFFDAAAIARWWQASRSVTTPRALGVYAVEWPAASEADDLLGRLGGVFHGTVIEYARERGFLVAEAWWLPPDGDPIGPMALEVTTSAEGSGCRLHVRQSGFDESARWRRYYAVIGRGWRTSLASLKQYVESSGPAGNSRQLDPGRG